MGTTDDDPGSKFAELFSAAIWGRWAGTDDSGSDLLTRALPDVSSPVLPEGSMLDRYRIVREIGRGGMGLVFEAEQDNPHRSVALKLIRSGACADEVPPQRCQTNRRRSSFS